MDSTSTQTVNAAIEPANIDNHMYCALAAIIQAVTPATVDLTDNHKTSYRR